jgi:hypothetical protein
LFGLQFFDGFIEAENRSRKGERDGTALAGGVAGLIGSVARLSTD